MTIWLGIVYAYKGLLMVSTPTWCLSMGCPSTRSSAHTHLDGLLLFNVKTASHRFAVTGHLPENTVDKCMLGSLVKKQHGKQHINGVLA